MSEIRQKLKMCLRQRTAFRINKKNTKILIFYFWYSLESKFQIFNNKTEITENTMKYNIVILLLVITINLSSRDRNLLYIQSILHHKRVWHKYTLRSFWPLFTYSFYTVFVK